MQKRAVLLVTTFVLVAPGARPSSAGTLDVTGPVIQSLGVGGVANPRLGIGAPISYSVATNGWTTVRLKVVDGDGDLVRLVESRGTSGGSFTASWDGRDASGAALPNGEYSLVADPAGYVFDRSIGEAGTGIGALNLPLGVDEAPDGTVWVADLARVVHYDNDGSYLGEFPASRPYVVRFDNGGSFWVTNGTPVAVRYDATGVENGRITLAAGNNLHDISQTSTGNLFAARWVPNYWTFQRFGANLTDLGTFGCCYNENRSVVESASGYILQACGGCGSILAANITGGIAWSTGNICFGGSCPGLTGTYGHIDQGENGGAVFAMYSRHQIGEFTGEFTNTALWAVGSQGTNHGQFQYPYGVARAGDKLYVADQYNNRIEVYTRSTPVSVPVRVDSTGPTVGGIDVKASENGGAILTIAADDGTTGGSNIAAAEVFFDETGPDGTGRALFAEDGSLDSAAEDLFGFLEPRNGITRLYLHAKDAAGNWGGFRSIDVLVVGAPASIDASAARATVAPGGADGGQRITAAVRDAVGNGLDGHAVTLTACPRAVPAACVSTTLMTSGGAAVWDVPPYALLVPGTYDVTATSGARSGSTSFDVLVAS